MVRVAIPQLGAVVYHIPGFIYKGNMDLFIAAMIPVYSSLAINIISLGGT